MSFAAKLIDTPERENSGADTASRYEFQALWGLALLFQNHGSLSDYAIVFEFHDDVALFDNSTEPLNVRFYQVKSKAASGNWTVQRLIERKKGSRKNVVSIKPSFIDRMYDNIHKFSPNVISVDFVSNQLCAINPSKPQFRFHECGADHFGKILKSVREAYPDATEAQVGLLGFSHTNLSLGDTLTHIKGKLHEFILSSLGDVTFNLETVYKAVVDECRRKSVFTGSYSNFAQVVRDKGITKHDVQTWLDRIAAEQRAPEWSEISVHLGAYPYLETVKIGQQYDIHRSAALNAGDAALHHVRSSIRKGLEKASSANLHSLVDVIEFVFDESREAAVKYLSPFKPERLKAMIAYEIHTQD